MCIYFFCLHGFHVAGKRVANISKWLQSSIMQPTVLVQLRVEWTTNVTIERSVHEIHTILVWSWYHFLSKFDGFHARAGNIVMAMVQRLQSVVTGLLGQPTLPINCMYFSIFFMGLIPTTTECLPAGLSCMNFIVPNELGVLGWWTSSMFGVRLNVQHQADSCESPLAVATNHGYRG